MEIDKGNLIDFLSKSSKMKQIFAYTFVKILEMFLLTYTVIGTYTFINFWNT